MRNLHRELARRLTLGGMAIALVLGGATLWMDLESVDEAIVAMGANEARLLSPVLPTDLDNLDEDGKVAVDAMLDSFIAQRAVQMGGHFVIAELYDLAQRAVADGLASDADSIEKVVDTSRHHFPDSGRTWYDKHWLDGRLYIQVVIPVRTQDGRQNGWFEGVYMVPPATLADVLWSGLHASLLVILAVAATSALLYPIMKSLSAGLVARSAALLEANLGTLEALGGAIAKRDSDTNAHNYRVTLYAVRLAEELGLGAERIRALIKGAFLHDVGKIAIPDAVLLKPGKLDDQEFAVMRTHVQHGLDIVGRFDWLKDAADVVGGHHEKFDGKGYPAGTMGEDIPVNARIFAIADVFDALTSRRPYKEPFSLEKALEIMAESRGSHFDPRALDCFIRIAPKLHAQLNGREDDGLVQELRGLTQDYFAATV